MGKPLCKKWWCLKPKLDRYSDFCFKHTSYDFTRNKTTADQLAGAEPADPPSVDAVPAMLAWARQEPWRSPAIPIDWTSDPGAYNNEVVTSVSCDSATSEIVAASCDNSGADFSGGGGDSGGGGASGDY